MVTEISGPRVVLQALGIVAVVLIIAIVGIRFSLRTPVPDRFTCLPLPSHFKLFGPALSVSQVERASLEQVSRSPSAPQVPFGYNNSGWLELKTRMLPGDTIHRYETGVSGGYVILRGTCVVGQTVPWVH